MNAWKTLFGAALSKSEKSRHDYRNSRELSNGKKEREIAGVLKCWSDGKVGWSAAMQQ
jgi:hypothetical protein